MRLDHITLKRLVMMDVYRPFFDFPDFLSHVAKLLEGAVSDKLVVAVCLGTELLGDNSE